MPASILITQCLQNDFVRHIERHDALPNTLHVGHAESRRLLGVNPLEGPVARTLRWAHAQDDAALRLVHIRDWHDESDPVQAKHLAMFGPHCLAGTRGAAFAFEEPADHGKKVEIIDATELNDFQGTRLARVLAPLGAERRRVGLVGVWTEAKISFLAYELCTRFPHWEVAVCSALTASSSRQHHFQAIDHLERILGVTVHSSVGAFTEWLADDTVGIDPPLLGLRERFPELTCDQALPAEDATLIRYLFRDCRTVGLRVLGGGFSGNLVASAMATDLRGHEQVPHVVKVGARDAMGRERTRFERIQDVMGNNAPQIADFADLGERGAIKYRYASMGGDFSTTFQELYQQGMPLPQVQAVLDTVFGKQLMRLYKAATLEHGDLLEHYYFSDRLGPRVRQSAETILRQPSPGDTLTILEGLAVPHPAVFYERVLPAMPDRAQDPFHQAYVHGDLNGANIMLDGHDNVWLIDFFHTRRAHVLMDLVKLENDLFYIFTEVNDEAELREAFTLTDALMDVLDLAAPLPETCPSALPQLQRAWATLRMLRAFHGPLVGSNRDPLQLFVAMLRYAGHTLSFDEPSPLQLKWALYTASRVSTWLTERLTSSTRLRVDWLADPVVADAKVGLTLMPGRRDRHRDLHQDLTALMQQGVDRVLCLVPQAELAHYGVPDLLDAYREKGFQVRHYPIRDQMGADPVGMQQALAFIDAGVVNGEGVLVHCVGGLGRAGMTASCWLVSRGLTADEAIDAVRETRGPRAVETQIQEDFVADFARS